MKLEVHIDVLTRRQDDGRVLVITVHPDGSIRASFNTYPYHFIEITKAQFQRYKPLLEQDNYPLFGIVEYWAEPVPRDNGLPKFINKIF